MPHEFYSVFYSFIGNFVRQDIVPTDKIGKIAKKGAKIVFILRGPLFAYKLKENIKL
jgi:hypothetical protein